MDGSTRPSAPATKYTECKQPLPIVHEASESSIYREAATARCQNGGDSVPRAVLGPIRGPPRSSQVRSRDKWRAAYIQLLDSPRRFVSMLFRTFRPQIITSDSSRRHPERCRASAEAPASANKCGTVSADTKDTVFKTDSSSPDVVKPSCVPETKPGSYTPPKSANRVQALHSFFRDSALSRNSERSPAPSAGLFCVGGPPEKALCHARLSPALCSAENRTRTRSVSSFAQRQVRLRARQNVKRNCHIIPGSVQHKDDVQTPPSKKRQDKSSAAEEVEEQACSGHSRLTSPTVHETVDEVCRFSFPSDTREPNAHTLLKETSDSCRQTPRTENFTACSRPVPNPSCVRPPMVDTDSHATPEQPTFRQTTATAAPTPVNRVECKQSARSSVSGQLRLEVAASVESFKTATSSLAALDGCGDSGGLPLAGRHKFLDTELRSAGTVGAPPDSKRKARARVQLKVGSARKGSSRRWCSRTRASCDFVVPRTPAGVKRSLEVAEKGKHLSAHQPQEREDDPGTANQFEGACAGVKHGISGTPKSQRCRSNQADPEISTSESFATACSDAPVHFGQLRYSRSLACRPLWHKINSATKKGNGVEAAAKDARDRWRCMPSTTEEPGLPFRDTYIGAKRNQAMDGLHHAHHVQLATSRNLLAYLGSSVVDGNIAKQTTLAEGAAGAVWREEQKSGILCPGKISRYRGSADYLKDAGVPYLLPCQKWEIPGSRSGTERLKMERRKQLPCAKSSVGNLSLKKILLQVSSSDMWNFSLPISVNEPLSLLQRLCEDLEYPELLATARSCPSSVERLAFVTSFALSAYASSADRCYKPFNPMLGETFELSHRGINFIGEQVSHHPPVSAYHAAAHNGNFVCFGTVAPRLSIVGTHVESSNCGAVYLRLFLPSGRHEDYTWSRANTKVHNVFFGAMWMEWTGEISVTNLTTGDNAQVSFLPPGDVHSTSQGTGSTQPVLGMSASSWLPPFRFLGLPAAQAGPSNRRGKAANAYENFTAARASRNSSEYEENNQTCSSGDIHPGFPSSFLTKAFDGKAAEERDSREHAQKADDSSPVDRTYWSEEPPSTLIDRKEERERFEILANTGEEATPAPADPTEPCAPLNTAADSSPLLRDNGLAQKGTRGPCSMVQSAPTRTTVQREGRQQSASHVPTSASIWEASSVVRRRRSGHYRRVSRLSREDKKGCTIQGVVRDTSGRPRFFLDGSWSQQLWLTKIGKRSFLTANPEAAVGTQESMPTILPATKVVARVAASPQVAPLESKTTAKTSAVLSTVRDAPENGGGCGGPDTEDGRSTRAARAPQRGSQRVSSRDSVDDVEDEQWCDDDLRALVWKARPKPEYAAQFYNMTSFAMELNELTADYYPENRGLAGSGGIAPTDSRLRPDLRKYEEGAVTAAQEEKNRLEAKQRQETRQREAKGEKWAPRWFSKKKNLLTGEEDWLYNGLYWRERVYDEAGRCTHRAEMKSVSSLSAEGATNRFEMCPSLF